MAERKIILAEDEPHTRLTLEVILKRAGYKVKSVPDGKQAVETIKENQDKPFELLLTDIQMPEMTGLELIREMKKKKIELPVIVFTGYGDKDTVVELLREGIEEYIDKPFTEEDLLNKVDQVFAKAEAKKEERESMHKQVVDIERKLDSYRSGYSGLCSSVDSAVHAYREIMGAPLKSEKVDVYMKSTTVDKLGGDFAAIQDTETGCDILVADVAGHDMGSSFHTIMIKSFFDENCRFHNSGNEFFNLLNIQLFNGGKNEKMATGIFLRINIEEMKVETVCAAHPYLLRFNSKNPNSILRPVSPRTGSVLGLMENPSFEVRCFNIHKGDRLFLYTDGIPGCCKTEARSGNKTLLGDEGLREILRRNFSASMNEMLDKSWKDIMKFCSYKNTDDMLLMGIGIKNGAQ